MSALCAHWGPPVTHSPLCHRPRVHPQLNVARVGHRPHLQCGSGERRSGEKPIKSSVKSAPCSLYFPGKTEHRLSSDHFRRTLPEDVKEKEHLFSPTRGLWAEVLLHLRKPQ